MEVPASLPAMCRTLSGATLPEDVLILDNPRILSAMFRARLVAAMVSAAEEAKVRVPSVAAVQLVDGIRFVQAQLRAELLRVGSLFGASNLVTVPIKGSHSLLWGTQSMCHTRDIDIAIDPQQYEQVGAILAANGYGQLKSIDRSSGALTHATTAQIRQSEPDGYYGYHSWSRVQRLSTVDAHSPSFTSQMRRGISISPLIEIGGNLSILFDFDIHHSLWPQLPFSSLRFAHSEFAGLARLSTIDRLVFHGAHMVARLRQFRRIAVLGQLRQLLESVGRRGNIELLDQCRERAAGTGLSEWWGLFEGLLLAVSDFAGADCGWALGGSRENAPEMSALLAECWRRAETQPDYDILATSGTLFLAPPKQAKH